MAVFSCMYLVLFCFVYLNSVFSRRMVGIPHLSIIFTKISLQYFLEHYGIRVTTDVRININFGDGQIRDSVLS